MAKAEKEMVRIMDQFKTQILESEKLGAKAVKLGFIISQSYLETILVNQIYVIAKLTNQPLETVKSETMERLLSTIDKYTDVAENEPRRD